MTPVESQVGSLLVVDDNEANRDMLRLRLEVLGYFVNVAEGGREALEMIASGGYEVIILDVMMPEIDGLEVLRRIRQTTSMDELPVIMATARDQSSDVVEALSLGANDYVTKPIDFPVLLARLRTQLQLRRLARQKSDFLSIASHDLKNPLSVIRGYSALLETMASEGRIREELAQDLLGRITRQTRTMERIITDYLDFQAVEDGQLALKIEPAKLNSIVLRVVEDLSDRATTKQIRVTTEVDDSVRELMLDEARIEQVLQNLIGNAIKFSEPEASVVVRTQTAEASVLCEVVDSGPGLTDDDLRKVFGRYARLSNKPTGGEKSSGLGLAICRHLVRLHNGEIGVRKNEGKGATFWFSLPKNSAG